MISSFQDSIVMITGNDPNNFGTGFVIHKDQHCTYLLTCTHVINNVGGNEGLKVDNHLATVIASDTEDGFDLAVLRVDKLLDNPILRLNPAGEKGRTVIVVGCYLYGNKKVIQELECFLNKSGNVVSENLKARGTCWHLEIQDEYHLEKGYSGAPVINIANNQVLGIINQRKGQGEKGLAISIESLAKVWPDLPREIQLNLIIEGSTPPVTPEAGPLMDFEKELTIFKKIVTGQDNQTRLISIHGPSLMGKSRLLREYRRLAHENNFEELVIDLKQQIDIDNCLDLIITKFEMEHFDQYYDYLSNKESKSLTREQEKDWHKNLTRIFYKNLKNCHDAQRLIIFFDHYEKADRDFKDWLNVAFLSLNFSPTPIILVIAGQEEIQVDPSWPGQYRFKLTGVDKDCYVRYADDCNAPVSHEDIDLVYEACQGNPAYFVMFVQSKLGISERMQ